MKAAVVLSILLLQKHSFKSKAKEHSTYLERNLNFWLEGYLNELLSEGRKIQQVKLRRYRYKYLAHLFANLIFEGKTKAAIHLLTEQVKGRGASFQW